MLAMSNVRAIVDERPLVLPFQQNQATQLPQTVTLEADVENVGGGEGTFVVRFFMGNDPTFGDQFQPNASVIFGTSALQQWIINTSNPGAFQVGGDNTVTLGPAGSATASTTVSVTVTLDTGLLDQTTLENTLDIAVSAGQIQDGIFIAQDAAVRPNQIEIFIETTIRIQSENILNPQVVIGETIDLDVTVQNIGREGGVLVQVIIDDTAISTASSDFSDTQANALSASQASPFFFSGSQDIPDGALVDAPFDPFETATFNFSFDTTGIQLPQGQFQSPPLDVFVLAFPIIPGGAFSGEPFSDGETIPNAINLLAAAQISITDLRVS